jgi:hypothetical protein
MPGSGKAAQNEIDARTLLWRNALLTVAARKQSGIRGGGHADRGETGGETGTDEHASDFRKAWAERDYPRFPQPQPAITIIFPTLSPLDSFTSHFGPHLSARFLGYLETEEIGARSTENRFH